MNEFYYTKLLRSSLNEAESSLLSAQDCLKEMAEEEITIDEMCVEIELIQHIISLVRQRKDKFNGDIRK